MGAAKRSPGSVGRFLLALPQKLFKPQVVWQIGMDLLTLPGAGGRVVFCDEGCFGHPAFLAKLGVNQTKKPPRSLIISLVETKWS